MFLTFKRGEAPSEVAEFVGPELYQASMVVRVGCGHEVEVMFSLTMSQLAQLGADYLAGTARPAEEVVARLTDGTLKIAPEIRCSACRHCVRH